MASPRFVPPVVGVVLAIVFGLATLVYAAGWIYNTGLQPTARLGVGYSYRPLEAALLIETVDPAAGASRAGVRPGDRILAIDGRSLDTPNPLYDLVTTGRPGDRHVLTLRRGSATMTVEVTLDPIPAGQPPLAQTIVGQLLRLYPVGFLIVALVVVFQKPHDRDAWLLALVFASFIASAPVREELVPASLRGFVVAYALWFRWIGPALFYAFFAVFPVPSPTDRRWPWLKHLLIGGALAAATPVAVWCLIANGSAPVARLQERWAPPEWVPTGYVMAGFALGITSLVWNSLTAPPDARRRTRVIMWGTVAGFAPMFLLQVLAQGGSVYTTFPMWVWAGAVFALFLIPLSFAYAVVKYRVMEIPVLLRRSARYVLVQRGFVVIIVLLSMTATIALAFSFAEAFTARSEIAVPAGLMIGVAFGLVLAWTGAEAQRRVTRRLDRAFFRSAYDARQILERVASSVHRARDRVELGTQVEHAVSDALHPVRMHVYLQAPDGDLECVRGTVPHDLARLPPDLPDLAAANERNVAFTVVPDRDWLTFPTLAALAPECLVPIQGREGTLRGLLVLGPRLSEEPYSREDRQLLSALAVQAGFAVEGLSMAEQMAERLEAERRAAREMQIARDVQRRLFPQKQPALATLEYAGACIQARAVGGDYYDFLDLGPGHLGLVLADISGKGIHAALLMANLQANLRSQYVHALHDLKGLLESVDRLFFESTPSSQYATMFFGRYDEAGRRLEYANCGHNPPLLLRATGAAEWLATTSPVLGLFDEWTCVLAETTIGPGDLLVIYTDGVTEAFSDHDEEFGGARLLDLVLRGRHLTPRVLLDRIVDAVQTFSGRHQEDDLTLVVARGV